MKLILTRMFRARQPKSLLDDCNRESGKVYTTVMATHWRVYRKHGIWLSKFNAMKLNDYLLPETILHAHSKDAAQESFYKGCKIARILKKSGNKKVRYPHTRKFYRTTIWKSTGIRVVCGTAFLSRAKGLEPVKVKLPENILMGKIIEIRLVFNLKSKHYDWHMVIEDGLVKPALLGENVVAVDLGEIHPAAVCDKEHAVVISARELRSTVQGRNKALGKLNSLQSRCKKGSRRYKRLQLAKNKLSEKSERKIKDINHKVSREVVDFAIERKARLIVIGDVRNISEGISIGKIVNQKLSQWTHGQQRKFITYKAAMAGMDTALQNEAFTSQTCPRCGSRHKQNGRTYKCSTCGWVGSRDGEVGAPNILSANSYGELARVQVQSIKYRHPFLTGKRSRPDTAHVAI